LIREINLYSDPFDGDLVQTLKSSCTKLMSNLDHQEKENITEGNTFINLYLLLFLYFRRTTTIRIGASDHETL